MEELVFPVPETVTAAYVVPVPTPMSAAQARRQAGQAVAAKLTGPLRMLTAMWLAQGEVRVEVELAAGTPRPPMFDDPDFGTLQQRAFIAQARTFVQFSATQRASLIGMQEWKARAPAAALAASLGAPVLDPRWLVVLTAEDALAGLPDTELTSPASLGPEVNIGIAFKPWVRIDRVEYLGMIGVMTDGMRRFGLPELRLAADSPELREELTALLTGVAFRVWYDLLTRAQETPRAAGLVNLPRFLRIPAQLDIHRWDLDRANGVENRGGAYATVGLQFDPANGEDPRNWLTVCPPADWDMSWGDFIADTCHAMFGFEKPAWHYLPELGALLEALGEARKTLPEVRSRFLRGDLPPGGRLMVRYRTPDTEEYRWATVESWADAGHAVARDAGRELAPGVRPSPPVTIEAEHILDWGIWVDGSGVVEGAGTEGVGSHLA